MHFTNIISELFRLAFIWQASARLKAKAIHHRHRRWILQGRGKMPLPCSSLKRRLYRSAFFNQYINENKSF